MELLLILRNLFLITLYLFICSCSNNVKEISYKKIKKPTANYEIDFCKTFEMGWDSILIVFPYTRSSSLESLNIKNINSIKRQLSEMESIDWKHYLILIKSNTAIAFVEIPRKYLDFDLTDNFSNTVIINHENCVLEYIENRIKVPNTI